MNHILWFVSYLNAINYENLKSFEIGFEMLNF